FASSARCSSPARTLAPSLLLRNLSRRQFELHAAGNLDRLHRRSTSCAQFPVSRGVSRTLAIAMGTLQTFSASLAGALPAAASLLARGRRVHPAPQQPRAPGLA